MSKFVEDNKIRIPIDLYGKFSVCTLFPEEDFLSFEEARKFVKSLGLNGCSGWYNYCKLGKKPNNIPVNPQKVYKDIGWEDWGDWLGTGNIATRKRIYLSFKKAKGFVRSLKLKSQKAWHNYCRSGKKPDNIPANANRVYKDTGWVNWKYFLGTGNVSFEEARKFVRNLKLKNIREWRKYRKSGKRPDNIPSTPDFVYKNKGWVNWYDFLGKVK